MPVTRLTTLDAFIAFDFDDAPVNAGGTRFAPDVTEDEAQLLARAMTYKFGAIGVRTGGAKGAIRGTPDVHDELLRAYCEEIRPLIESAKFLTGPDLGTSEKDFAPLRNPDNASIMAREPDLEDLLTGFGLVVAAETAIGSLDGRTIAIEGFGKVGGGVAREAIRRGAAVTAVSTIDGVVRNENGLDVELLLALRSRHGDGFVGQTGYDFDDDRTKLFETKADILVPGARTGVITKQLAEKLTTPWIAPAANVPYCADAIETLKARRIRYLPDFVCNAGATIGYTSNAQTAREVFAIVEAKVADLMARASSDPRGPYEGACAIAEEFISTWHEKPTSPPTA